MGGAGMGNWEVDASPGRLHFVSGVISGLITDSLSGPDLYSVYDSERRTLSE